MIKEKPNIVMFCRRVSFLISLSVVDILVKFKVSLVCQYYHLLQAHLDKNKNVDIKFSAHRAFLE
jgi:hypothetical protein